MSDLQIGKNVAKHFNRMIGPGDIEFCRRLRGKSETSPIMVRFASKYIAENIISKYFASNGKAPLKISNISDDNISCFFINEHLTNYKMNLYSTNADVSNVSSLFRQCWRGAGVSLWRNHWINNLILSEWNLSHSSTIITRPPTTLKYQGQSRFLTIQTVFSPFQLYRLPNRLPTAIQVQRHHQHHSHGHNLLWFCILYQIHTK